MVLIEELLDYRENVLGLYVQITLHNIFFLIYFHFELTELYFQISFQMPVA